MATTVKATGKVIFRDLGSGAYELNADDGRTYALVGRAIFASRLKGGETITVEGELVDAPGLGMTGSPQIQVRQVTR